MSELICDVTGIPDSELARPPVSRMRKTGPIDDLYAKLGLKNIPALDGLRGIAIVLVLCYHFSFPPGIPGPMGVTIFFVLSGFLITWLLLKENERSGTVSLRSFYKRRALRIFPAFYCYWFLSVVVLWLAHRKILWSEFGSAFLYFSNYYYSFASPQRPFMPFTWSLAVEEQFYFLWPTLFLLYRHDLKKLTYFLLGVIMASWVYRAILCFGLHSSEIYLQHSFDTRLDSLLTGALLAVLLKRKVILSYFESVSRTPIAPAATIALLCLSVVLGDLITFFDYRHTIGYMLEPALIATLIVQMIALGNQGAWSWINARPVRMVGVLSYSIYLYHFSTARVLQELMPDAQWRWRYQLAARFLGSIAVAAASYYLIERPFLKLKDRKVVEC
jgi:peptidoglycan/LPS O-acetylase OafA/YrhL